MPTYKQNRKKTRKPITYRPLMEYVHETCDTYERETMEGDDVLGILATHPTLIPGEKIIVAIDKDMQTVPGLHLNYEKARKTGDYEPFEVTEDQANRFHFTQTLTGDVTDGYPGCPGVGPVKAAKILDAAEEPWPAIVAAYEKAGLSEAEALRNARVARICRASDYDFKGKKVILWSP
jgi:DNA polymerase I